MKEMQGYKSITYIDKYNCPQIYSEFSETEAIKRLAELENEIRKNKIVYLKYNVGDMLWVINKTKYGLPFVMDINIEWFEIHNNIVFVGNHNPFQIQAWSINKVYSTREEAENKLKERQNGNEKH